MTDKCWIWPQFKACVGSKEFPVTYIIDSPRVGGLYEASIQTQFVIGELDESQKAIMTTHLIEQRSQGVTIPVVTTAMIEHVKAMRPLPVHERSDRLLRFIADQTKIIGTPYQVEPHDPAALAWSESTGDNEVGYLLDYLLERELLQQLSGGMLTSMGDHVIPGRVMVTVEGHNQIALLKATMRGEQAFIAMWFHDDVNHVSGQAIEPAIRDAGYVPFRIDRTEYIDKIDDEIIAEIRRSRFLVADFSHGSGTVRGSVYYEAGFAHGLNIPVIFTCREGSDLHFDTNHYNHIVWTDPEELREKLKNRILAVIGEGPRVHND